MFEQILNCPVPVNKNVPEQQQIKLYYICIIKLSFEHSYFYGNDLTKLKSLLQKTHPLVKKKQRKSQ